VTGASFAQLLDDLLDGGAPASFTPPAAVAGSPFLFTVRPPHPLLFFRIQSSGEAAVPAEVHALRSDMRRCSPRRAERLTDEERAALETLEALGVTLAPEFTAAELRRQYRLLARRIHPDRHPAAQPDERQRLSRAFAAATDSYRVLSRRTTAH
jgi:hypothetical protein